MKAILNHIIFEFVDGLDSQHNFTQTTASGIHIVGHHDSSAKDPRWAKVLHVGPDVDAAIKIGSTILIEPLRWTEGVKHGKKTVWKTDDTQVLCVDVGND